MWPVLSPTEPIPGVILYGDAGMAVMVAGRLGLPSAPATIEGPFVVAAWRAPSAGEPGFEVVDRFSDVTLVDVPTARTETPAPAATPTPAPTTPMSPPSGVLTADELMTALANRSLDGRIVSFDAELKTVAWPCPADVPEPCTRFYVDGLPGIALTYSGAVAGSVGSDGGAGVSKMTGRMVVVPRNGHLELLGRLDRDLGAPVDFGPVFDGAGDPSQDPFEVTPVTGWLIRDAVLAECRPTVHAAGTTAACSGPVDVLSNQAPLPPSDASSSPGATTYPVNATSGPGLEQYVAYTAGPFLVRPAYGAGSMGWAVLARYDPGAILQVVLP